MKFITARNAHAALPQAIELLQTIGYHRESRNGMVLVSPEPVTTVYSHPYEKLVFYDERDVNVAFLVYEALWMLAGRRDVAPFERYVARMKTYSDDGQTFHGAYGFRWREAFGVDQLEIIANRLRKDATDRRCVLQMWDTISDLGVQSKDLPCNTMATFQVNLADQLDMVVFNRSNDIIWGTYFANAFQFGTLLEYMAAWIGCEIGTYSQVSVNFHAYTETLRDVKALPSHPRENPYAATVSAFPLSDGYHSMVQLNREIQFVLREADTGFQRELIDLSAPMLHMYCVLRAHHLWRTIKSPARYNEALLWLRDGDGSVDLITAMVRWIERRQAKWKANSGADI